MSRFSIQIFGGNIDSVYSPQSLKLKSGQNNSQKRRALDSKQVLRKSDLLKKRFEFLRIKEQGTRLVGRFLCIDQRKGASLRFGITVSKKYGNSPERNRFKRLVRESFRTARHLLPQDSELNFSPRNYAKHAKMSDIQNEMLQLLK